jgi:Protein of unknown function (DUF3429)
MPTIAIPLSLLGLVPLIIFACGAVGQDAQLAQRLVFALIDYAALILAFAGGTHWGLAMLPEAIRPSLRMSAGVFPLIIAWIALVLAQLLAPWVALGVLIVGYLATVLTEHRSTGRAPAPARFLFMRWTFSLVAVVMMAMVLIVRGLGQTIVF